MRVPIPVHQGRNYVVYKGVDVSSLEEGASIGTELGGPIGAIIGGVAGEVLGGETVFVTFTCHGGGTRTYKYTGREAVAIEAGANPSQFDGERVA
jgi:hypothetical protein